MEELRGQDSAYRSLSHTHLELVVKVPVEQGRKDLLALEYGPLIKTDVGLKGHEGGLHHIKPSLY